MICHVSVFTQKYNTQNATQQTSHVTIVPCSIIILYHCTSITASLTPQDIRSNVYKIILADYCFRCASNRCGWGKGGRGSRTFNPQVWRSNTNLINTFLLSNFALRKCVAIIDYMYTLINIVHVCASRYCEF